MYEKVQVARDVALGFAEGFAKGVRCYVEGLSVPRRRARRTFASCVPGFVEGLLCEVRGRGFLLRRSSFARAVDFLDSLCYCSSTVLVLPEGSFATL